jgi:hypothetical protein
MATTTGTFTVKGNDLGNLPAYIDISIYSSNAQIAYTFNYNGSGTLVSILNNYINDLNINYSGTFSYTLDGPGVWNGGTDTIVKITYTDMLLSGLEIIPYYLVLSTEDYQYAALWSYNAPAVPTLCNTCQMIQLNQCGDENFRLDLGLADGSYTAFYTDNTSGVLWEQGTYSDQALGGLNVYQWQATAGMFNQYSFYTMTLRDSNGDSVSWVVDGAEYTCATLTFRTTVNVTD